MRERDVKRSFGNAVTWRPRSESTLQRLWPNCQQFPFGDQIPGFKIFGENTRDLSGFSDNYDLVYLDPPYLILVEQASIIRISTDSWRASVIMSCLAKETPVILIADSKKIL